MAFWDDVAAEVSAALGGPELNLTMAIRKRAKTGPDYAPTLTPTYHRIVGAQFDNVARDETGTFVGVLGRRLLVRTAEGVVPYKGDEVMIEGAEAFLAAPTDDTWQGVPVTDVKTVAPAGTAVLYTVFVEG